MINVQTDPCSLLSCEEEFSARILCVQIRPAFLSLFCISKRCETGGNRPETWRRSVRAYIYVHALFTSPAQQMIIVRIFQCPTVKLSNHFAVTEPKRTIILQSPGRCKYKCKHRCKQVPDEQLNNTSLIQILKWHWQKASPSVLLFQPFCPASFPDGRRRSKVHDGQQVRAALLLPRGRQDHVRGVSARSAHHRWGSFQSAARHGSSWFNTRFLILQSSLTVT